MKKFLCLLSLCFMTVGFVGCGEETTETEAPAATGTDDTTAETETETDGE